jgi:heptaprenylglyceryl phosphate synthase
MSRLGAIERRLTSGKQGHVGLAALIDPDNFEKRRAVLVAETVEKLGFDCVFVGGSTLGDQTHLDAVVLAVKRHVTCPVTLTPSFSALC